MMYDALISKFEELRTRAAKFYRVALHMHSPDSHDWAHVNCDSERNSRSRLALPAGAELFVDELSQHLDVVAITDHMKCSFAVAAASEAATRTDCVVLPGMEVNIQGEAALGVLRVHILTILPGDAEPAHFDRLFHGMTNLPTEQARTGHEEIRIGLKDWVTRVHEEDGICIAAHIDNSQGTRRLFRQTSRSTLRLFSDPQSTPHSSLDESEIPEAFRNYILDTGIDAIGVARHSDSPHYRFTTAHDGREVSIPCILTFDAHCIEDLDRPARITHIKMTTPGLPDLKAALRFPDTRIRYPETLPTATCPRLIGISVTGGSDSFFKSLDVGFAENLNCVIGPRGSGKSTLVEAIRYTIGLNAQLSDLDSIQKDVRSRQNANLSGCIIRIAFLTRSNETHVLQCTFDPKEDNATKAFHIDGTYIDFVGPQNSAHYPIRLFGWSEIEALGRSRAMQRELLDRLMPNVGSAIQRRHDCRCRLAEVTSSIQSIASRLKSVLESNGGIMRRYAEFLRDFNTINTDSVQDQFSALDMAHGKREALRLLKESANRTLKELDDISIPGILEDTQTFISEKNTALEQWWSEEMMQEIDIPAIGEAASSSIGTARSSLIRLVELCSQKLADVVALVSTTRDALRSSFAEDTDMQRIADLRTNAKKRLAQAQEVREGYLSIWNELIQSLELRRNLATELEEAHGEVTGIRQEHLARIEAELSRFMGESANVSLLFQASADREEFASAVEPFLSAASRYKARKLGSLIADNFTPLEFAKLIVSANERDADTIVESLSDQHDSRFTSRDLKQILDSNRAFKKDDLSDVMVLVDHGTALIKLLKLAESSWDDAVTIVLDGAPIDTRSPGQRSSAMLPLIALAEDAPLVIDQPEDNLDRRLIGQVLANVLSELKEKRQIIVCTHDPNIVVGGDAEQVIVLDAEGAHEGRVADHGSIDTPEIVQTVIDLLEGGERAFETRKRRYGG